MCMWLGLIKIVRDIFMLWLKISEHANIAISILSRFIQTKDLKNCDTLLLMTHQKLLLQAILVPKKGVFIPPPRECEHPHKQAVVESLPIVLFTRHTSLCSHALTLLHPYTHTHTHIESYLSYSLLLLPSTYLIMSQWSPIHLLVYSQTPHWHLMWITNTNWLFI